MGVEAYLWARLNLEKTHHFPTKSPKTSDMDTLSSSPSSARIGDGWASDSPSESCPVGEFEPAGCPPSASPTRGYFSFASKGC